MALKFAVNNSLSAVTSLPASISGGDMTLLQTQTASSSATIDFTSNIDSTYDVYCFKFIDIHPSVGDQSFQINFRDGGSSFDATKTTTMFRSTHRENAGLGQIDYLTGSDLAQSTSAQQINTAQDNDNDSCLVGELYLYNPSSTTFVKHFIARSQMVAYQTTSHETYVAGYCNVTAAIDGVQFSMSSGNIDSGVIKLYGIS